MCDPAQQRQQGLDTTVRLEGFDDTDDASYLVHLHGDYRYDALRNTTAEVVKLDEALRKKLIERVRKRPIIVIGYGGWDESVLSALEEAVSQKSEGGGIYWCVSAGQSPNGRVVRLLEQARKQGFDAEIVEIEHFDDFMVRVARFVLRSRPELGDVEELLAVEPPTRSPLRLPDNEPQKNWLKSNGFPIVLPTSLYQFEVAGVTGWADLRTLVRDRQLCAGLLKGKVLTLGSIEDIRSTFDKRITSDVVSVPLDQNDFDDDSVVMGVLRQAVTTALAAHCGVDPVGKQRLAEQTRASTERIDGVTYDIHRAATIELSRVGSQSFLHIIPDIVVRAPGGAEVPSSVRKEIKRRQLGRQWNRAYYSEVEEWKNRIFGAEQQVSLRFPAGGTHDFRFTLQAPARYAELLSSVESRSTPSKARIGVQFRALIVGEPQLRFGDGRGGAGLDPHPMRGLVKYGPYDAELAREERCNEVRASVVAPRGTEPALEGV